MQVSGEKQLPHRSSFPPSQKNQEALKIFDLDSVGKNIQLAL